jgi:signal transduction histidine kinase
MASSAQLSYDDLQQKVQELEDALDAICHGKVDTLTSEYATGRLLVLRDYGQDLEQERQLAELRMIVETVPIPLAIVWGKGDIRLANRAFLEVSGPGAAVTLREWVAGLQADDRLAEMLDANLSKSLHDVGHPTQLQTTFKTHAGDERCWLLSFQKLPGKVEGASATTIAATDLTDAKCLIVQLRDAKAQMEEFLAAAAHDLKSPLITIAHNVTFARMSLGETMPAETAECLDRAKSAGKDMLELLRQLSEVSRAGRDTEPRKGHSFRELVQSAIRQLEGTLAQRRANVVVGDNLPKLYCQGTKFVQVFSNLISNAVKYTPAERRPHIEVAYQPRPGPEHLFSVSDNGMGIPPECLQKVFGLFERLSDDPRTPGQGVGLTVVRRIVELHEGRVWVESIPDKGSVFYFTVGQQRKDGHEHDN